MLTEKQVKEIRTHLEKAQNPLFFFDNDPDGLCSFLLLRRAYGKGKGIPVRSFPDLNVGYFRRIEELNSDYVFILDKPIVSEEFLKEAEIKNIPIVWIDHHETDFKIPDHVNYYNPTRNKNPSSEPVTFLSYKLANNKDDMWLAVIGCVSDKFIPDFYDEFLEKYPDLAIKTENAFDVFYASQIGRIARIFSFALKDSITNVVSMLRFLLSVKNPYEVLEENKKNYSMHKRFKQIYSRYTRLLIKAEEYHKFKEKILFFQYGGDLSISSDISNELSYRFPNKIIVVVYVSGVKANISVRGNKIREIILDIISELEGATGGGHENAVGVQIKLEDLEKFRKKLYSSVK